LLPPPPPTDQADAGEHQAGQSRAGDGAWNNNWGDRNCIDAYIIKLKQIAFGCDWKESYRS